MTDRLRLGIVGCGDIAGYTALFARLNRRISLTACCDNSLEKSQAFSHRHKIPKFYIHYEEMLDRESLDAVYLAVPHHLHFPMAQAAIQAGLHIFIEKPLTRTLAEALTLAKLAELAQIRLGVNYQYRYDAGCYALAQAAQRGDLGVIHTARCNIPWHREASYFQQAGWHARRETAGGGSLLTQGSHMLDIVLWALGSRPDTASGYTARRKFKQVEVEDLAHGLIEMQDGALVQISSSMVANPEQALTIELYGEDATALYTDRPLPHVTFRGRRIKKALPPVRGLHALQRSLEGFRAWVMEDRSYLTPYWEAIPVLATVEAIYRSAQTGCRESISLGELP
jgi:UDP-N-acetyl-2-amino-2-deoxyglucuronate dehydrogenase